VGDAAVPEDLEHLRAEIDLLRRRVINVVGHELRTPITTLRGLAELLGTAESPEAESELHDAIRRTARRVEGLLDDLLVATGVSTALPVGQEEPVHIAEAARAAWAALDALPAARSLEVEGDAAVLARPAAIRRLLSALLDNALRYGEPPVSVTTTTTDGQVLVVVADHGPGVPAAELTLVPEPFFRGERAVLEHHSLGLGLAVARALAEQHDGELHVRNRDGGGLAVEVRLPVARPS
jgi:signal transduction histidine kinase